MTTLQVPGPEAFGAKPHERPVPRISIHAFVEFPDTGAALQRAAADRRLSKAHLNVVALTGNALLSSRFCSVNVCDMGVAFSAHRLHAADGES